MVDQRTELIKRLVKATGPDRAIDAAIYRLLAVDRQQHHWFTFREGEHYSDDTVPPLTASIDAALELVERVLPGWEYEVSSNHGMPFYARICAPDWTDPEHEANGASAPLAILIALLRALKSQEIVDET